MTRSRIGSTWVSGNRFIFLAVGCVCVCMQRVAPTARSLAACTTYNVKMAHNRQCAVQCERTDRSANKCRARASLASACAEEHHTAAVAWADLRSEARWALRYSASGTARSGPGPSAAPIYRPGLRAAAFHSSAETIMRSRTGQRAGQWQRAFLLLWLTRPSCAVHTPCAVHTAA